MHSELEKAWNWREKWGIFTENVEEKSSNAFRVFHGPGEGSEAFLKIAIDRFGAHYWVTVWGKKDLSSEQRSALEKIRFFLESKGAVSAVWILRPEGNLSQEPFVLFGVPPLERFEVTEGGVRYWVKMKNTFQPGLFLDQAPLRAWLKKRTQGLRVLNAFAYTGSLSVACGLGGASSVTTLDLSNPTIQWAKQNWILNGLSESLSQFIAGDVFEWMPRLKRKGETFDCVILDPPSSSVGKRGRFSTAHDLPKLHSLAMDLLVPGGLLISSINSVQFSRQKFETELLKSVPLHRGKRATVFYQINLPETFPTRLDQPQERYLKGLCLKID
jgi:23S rRNA (cytosine1962-C5)-methyltransferase